MSDVLETGDVAPDAAEADTPAFGTLIGVVPTHEGAVADVYDALRRGVTFYGEHLGMLHDPE